jgi:hypothetical protein
MKDHEREFVEELRIKHPKQRRFFIKEETSVVATLTTQQHDRVQNMLNDQDYRSAREERLARILANRK